MPERDQEPVRVLLAKIGFDGHDRGLKVVARILRDAGIEVVYLGLRQTYASVVAAAEQEDVDVVGVSTLNGGHMTIGPRLVGAIADAGLDTAVVVGGIVPDDDLTALLQAGVAAVLTPGTSAEAVATAVREAASRRRTGAPRVEGS